MASSTVFSASVIATTTAKIFYGTESDTRELIITRANCLVSISSTSGTYGEITIIYTLTNARATACSIRPYYSTDGGTNFTEATKGGSGDDKTALTTSASGTSHTFVWNSYTDVGNDYVGDVIFKIRAYDRDNYIGDYIDSSFQNISIMNAPSAPTTSTPSDDSFSKDDTPQFVCTIPSDNNPDNYYSKVHVKLEVDTVDDFNSPDLEVFESRLDQVGWEYQNIDVDWTAVPATGIQLRPNMAGQYVRFTLPTEDRLQRTTLYYRMTFGGIPDTATGFINIGIIIHPEIYIF